MASSRRVEWGLAVRLALAIALSLLFVLSFWKPGLLVARLVLGAGAALSIWALWHELGRSNRAIARFVEAIRYDDFAQRFSLGEGAGFDALGRALDGAILELGQRRMEAANEVRFLSAVVEDAPIALLTIEDGDRVRLLNKAARRQFGTASGSRIADFAPFGSEFVAALSQTAAGRRLTRVLIDGTSQRTIMEAARIERLGEDIRIVSLLPVQNMLGNAEMAAQTDLVRVLTHEIMNSLTPVTSLARTAADLLASAPGDSAELQDARTAIDTVARRAEGMHRFVDSYRSFASAPDVRRRRFEAGPWADEILRIFAADPASVGVKTVSEVEAGLVIDADAELLAQLSLNILRNGAAAASAHATAPMVRFHVSRSPVGAVVIEVADNGEGIAPERREDIFLPFYTTRAEGHGVGLSFVRQVATAHGGAISVGEALEGGALLKVVLP